MNQNGLYLPHNHITAVLKKIQIQQRTPAEEAFYFYLLSTAQKLPIKGLIPPPDTRKAKRLFATLPSTDRIWLIPVLEGDNKIRHWTYTTYDKLFEQRPERLMLAFFRIREYRYRIAKLRKKTTFNTHFERIAQIIHAKDRRLNRYGLHIFLYQNNKLVQRGGHRRRALHPIETQESIEQPQKLVLTTKGTGKLRYTLSWREQQQHTEAQGVLVKQEYHNQNELRISFQLNQKGSVWIFDQLPSVVQPIMSKTEWMEEYLLQENELWIRTKELEAGAYTIHIPIKMKLEGNYHDPPVRIARGDVWVGQSASNTIQVKK